MIKNYPLYNAESSKPAKWWNYEFLAYLVAYADCPGLWNILNDPIPLLTTLPLNLFLMKTRDWHDNIMNTKYIDFIWHFHEWNPWNWFFQDGNGSRGDKDVWIMLRYSKLALLVLIGQWSQKTTMNCIDTDYNHNITISLLK